MANPTPATVAELVTAAKDHIRNLSPAGVSHALEVTDAVLLDLREEAEIPRTGVIPGAIRAPRGMLEFYADPTSPYHMEELRPTRPVILYCASGGRSALAGRSLQQLGYVDVAHLEGGIKAWEEDGRPLLNGDLG